MSFGLSKACNTFQRLMDQVLGDLPFCFVYMDDILILAGIFPHTATTSVKFSPLLETWTDHWMPKCEFAVSKIKFLLHLLSATGCSPLAKHSATISAFPPPSDKPALQRFLGMVNFYRKFLQGSACVLPPHTDVLKGPDKPLS